MAILLMMLSTFSAMAQQSKLKIRIAKIEIDPTYLTAYQAALAEHAEAAVKVEPGVLTLNAVYDKEHPTHVTVFEIYASEEAYQKHLKTDHFLKYKNGTLKMVKSLQLTDVEPISLQTKFVPEKR
ncbi:antibiotic biosynthesis monooxygenase family protein [Chitinophaga niabensis]|uniref:putative quinol monooxygenase n=1 Tax=Chitinophaga niabensis TaxID=536979 RepID=UPI0031BAF89B